MRNGMNEMVPLDDLHWDRESKRFNILSPEDTKKVLRSCVRDGVDNPADILKVVNEYEVMRAGMLIYERFFSGAVRVCGFEDDGTPVFEAKPTQED